MNGKAHLTIGTLTGVSTGLMIGGDPVHIGLLGAAGGISALLPDLDTKSTISNRLSFTHSLFKILLFLFGIILTIYSFLISSTQNLILIAIGLLLILISFRLSYKISLLLTGLLLLGIGLKFNTLWLTLFGMFIIVSIFLPHRSYTHSLIGLIFFGYISLLMAKNLKIDGLFLACVLGYASHLVADMKFIPTNKKGVKLFQPFSKQEI